MSEKNHVVDEFFTIVQRGVRKHGHEKIIRSIQVIDIQKNNIFYYEIFNFIIQSISQEFNIKQEDFYKKDKRGVVTVARKIAIVLVKTHFDITDEQLANQFDRTRQIVYNTRKEYLKMREDNPKHKVFLEKHSKLNKKVVDYIKKIKGE